MSRIKFSTNNVSCQFFHILRLQSYGLAKIKGKELEIELIKSKPFNDFFLKLDSYIMYPMTLVCDPRSYF